MEPLVVAVLVGLGVYVITIALIPKKLLFKTGSYTQHILDELEAQNTDVYDPDSDARSVLRDQAAPPSIFAQAFFLLPGTQRLYPRLIKAGLEKRLDMYFGALLALLIVLTYFLRQFGLFSIIIAAIVTVLVGRWYVKRRIAKRNGAFLNVFPDALDMIVRSLRSGYPMNAAIRMVADNMQPPVSDEFRQVADEIAYGSPLVDALKRLSMRIDEPDIRFFVVVLAVQQDVGGNLAEVLSNLSGIIRKRKHLRLKIKALTSEGVAAAWVLGMLPLFEFIMIDIFSPTHLEPFFNSQLGGMMLATAIGIVLLGLFIVNRMINIDV